MTRHLLVLDPGPLTTVQDPGRPGLAHLGVPRSGWLDAPAARLANRLVGNPEQLAVLECLLGGLALEAANATTVAVTGARGDVRVSGRAGSRLAAHGTALTLAAGERLELGRVREGARCYVAVAGGVAVSPVLGSRSTDTLSGLGPPVVAAGDRIPVGPVAGPPAAGEAVPLPTSSEVVLRCRPGPRRDWLRPEAWSTLTTASYAVQPDSNRVGLRLSGPPLMRSRDTELPSEGLVLGAVQLPPDGQPLVFLNEHPTTGGYPVVAVVEPADLATCAQLRPGDVVGFSQARGGAGG